jgi:hypothetical protein
MVDLWELLDRVMNIHNLIKVVIGGIAYAISKRDKLKRIAVKLKDTKPPEVVVQMKPATARVHALTATPRLSRESPTTLEELLAWYLRIASSSPRRS